MSTFTVEHSAYPVKVQITEPDGSVMVVNKARLTFRNGVLGVYDANIDAPFIFAEVLVADTIEPLQRKGNELEVALVDGRTVWASAPQGCGCGDKGKRYTRPADYPEIVAVPSA